jgi:hypothetical protein
VIKEEHEMKASYTLIALLAFGLSAQPFAQQVDRQMSDHPAVIVKRQEARQGYDYQSKFYPHPAWLYLQAEAPRPMMDHPAVIVAKRNRNAGNAQSPTGIGALSASLR